MIWFPCYIISTLSFIFCYLYYGSTFVPIFYYFYLLWIHKHPFLFIFPRGVHSKIKIFKSNKWLKQTHCVRFFTKMHSGVFMILLVNKSDTMSWIIYWVDLSCICSLNSDLSRHSMLSHLLSGFWRVNKADTLC